MIGGRASRICLDGLCHSSSLWASQTVVVVFFNSKQTLSFPVLAIYTTSPLCSSSMRQCCSPLRASPSPAASLRCRTSLQSSGGLKVEGNPERCDNHIEDAIWNERAKARPLACQVLQVVALKNYLELGLNQCRIQIESLMLVT